VFGAAVVVPVSVLKLQGQGGRQAHGKVVISPGLPHPLSHGVIDVGPFVPGLTRGFAQGRRLRQDTVHMPCRVEHLNDLQNHFDNMFIAVPFGTLVGIEGKQEKIHGYHTLVTRT